MKTVYASGDIVMANPASAGGHQQKGIRPWLIVSNNIGNKHSPIYSAIPFTTRRKNPLPTHVRFAAGEGGLPSASTLLCELEMVIEKEDCLSYVGHVEQDKLVEVACAMAASKPIVVLAFENGFHNTESFVKLAKA